MSDAWGWEYDPDAEHVVGVFRRTSSLKWNGSPMNWPCWGETPPRWAPVTSRAIWLSWMWGCCTSCRCPASN